MEQEEGRELMKVKHVCKFCSKSFPCGRSLGGHMRSHIITNNNNTNVSAEAAEVKKIQSLVINLGSNKVSEYGLRENPKKTWRFQDSSRTSQEEENSQPLAALISTTEEDKNKLCRECGKVFHSWKALFGHMKCHSEKASMKVSGAHEVVTDSQSDNEGSGNSNPNRRRRSKRRRTRFVNSASTSSLSFVNHTSSSVSEDEQEQEEVAMSLIMLSRDVGNWGGLNSHVDSSDNNSAYFEARSYEAKDSQNLKSKGKKPMSLALVSINGLVKKKYASIEDSEDDQVNGTELDFEVKKGKFKCTTCNKMFHSYQALGGHRSNHKKMKGCSVLRNDHSSGNSIETDLNNGCCVNFENEEEMVIEEPNSKKNKVHECPICFKIFSSGQALGGHKRSHFSAAMEGSSSIVIEKPVQEVRDFLDLNLPPEEEEISNSQFMENNYPPWWVVQGHHHNQPKQEPLVGLISS